MASTYLQRTLSASSSREQWTFSAWVKISGNPTGSYGYLFSCTDASSHTARISIMDNNVAKFGFVDSLISTDVQTNRLLRDNNSWYHLMVVLDTTLSTASDRVKLYVNGVRETSLANTSYPSVNAGGLINYVGGSYRHNIGSYNNGSSNFFNGIMSDINFSDGYALEPTVFGETDATTGEWKIIGDPTFTPGTNGFTILRNGNTITDQSTNSNNWSLGGGTLTKTEDCPSNVFCTWNPLYRSARKDMTLTNGNTFIFEQNSGDSGVSGTIAVSSGKWYWEQIIAQVNGTNAAVIGGLHTTEDWNESPTDALSNNTCGMRANGNVYKNGSDLGNFTTANPNGDIFGIGFDADNGSVYFWRNGTALNSGNAIITGLDMTKTWIPFGIQHGGARVTTSTNWGNGYFQTTAVSSAGTNASGNGIFEYDVPTGYTALSTKGLNL